MSYRNPQTVIDTESAKYYAQAISSIGQGTVKALNTRFAKAQAIKKSNLKSQADLVKFSSGYLKDVNKSLKDFNITPQFRKLLDGEVNKAAELRQQLANINLTGNDRLSKQNELNALETFFDAGLPNALENLKGKRDEISAKQVNIGQEGFLSASVTNPQVLNDINDTFSGNPKANYDFNIIRDSSGALNVSMTFLNKESIRTQDGKYFGEKEQTAMDNSKKATFIESQLSGTMIDRSSVKVGDKLKASKTEPRTYNLNSDFTPQSLVINPVINKGVSENLENEKITLNGAIDPNSMVVFGGEENGKKIQGIVDGTTIIKTVDKNNIVKEYEVDNLNIDRFKTKMLPGLKAQIAGVVKQGRASDGDMGSGLVAMQSWTDDVLGEDIDLEPSAETDHGLTPESYKKLTDAILGKKHRELQDTMPRLREVGVEETDDRTADEKNEARRKANLSKEIDLLGRKLEEKVIPTFISLDDPNVNKLITYIENLDGIKSVDFSKNLAKGDKSSFKVVGNLGKSVTIDTGMSQAQIKKAILKAAGADDKQVNVFDFTKTDNEMIVGRNIVEVPNEFDVFKR
tara:strand:+ start:655 stop:2373 length:1719 start_codon:yes stop_codon:yes gene_type:complete